MKNNESNLNKQSVIYPKSNIITESYKLYEVNKEEELRIEVGPKEEINIIVRCS
jgi:hypothetical protein